MAPRRVDAGTVRFWGLCRRRKTAGRDQRVEPRSSVPHPCASGAASTCAQGHRRCNCHIHGGQGLIERNAAAELAASPGPSSVALISIQSVRQFMA